MFFLIRLFLFCCCKSEVRYGNTCLKINESSDYTYLVFNTFVFLLLLDLLMIYGQYACFKNEENSLVRN